jgi:DNA-binding phage protein
MLDKTKLQKYIKNAPNFETDLINRLQDKDYQKDWLELTLNEFLTDGDLDTFIRCLTDVVKARVKSSGRGEITRLAKELKIDRSNLSEIVNGDKQPRLETAFKLLNGLGFKYDIKLKSA